MSDKAKQAPKKRPVNSEDQEQARIEAILRDPDPGASAAVMREVARLQENNRHLKKQNLRAWAAVAVLGAAIGIGQSAQFWYFPKYRNVATTDNRAVCDLSTSDTARVKPTDIEDRAKEAVLASYSYDYVNYRKIINETTAQYFTKRGRDAFYKSLDASGNLERVVKGRLIMKAFATNAPQLEAEGKEGSQTFWIVYVPMAIEFYVGGNPAPTNTQDFLAEVKVIQEQPSATNLKGIAIDSVVLKPSSRRN